MIGWGLEKAVRIVAESEERKTVPTELTLTEAAAAAQRAQLQTLVEAVSAHPDLAAQLFAALKRSP